MVKGIVITAVNEHVEVAWLDDEGNTIGEAKGSLSKIPSMIAAGASIERLLSVIADSVGALPTFRATDVRITASQARQRHMLCIEGDVGHPNELGDTVGTWFYRDGDRWRYGPVQGEVGGE